MNKSVVILSVILVVQIIIYAVASIDRHHATEKEDFLTVDTSEVNYLKIVNDKGDLVMKRIGVNWKISEPVQWRANESYVETLLEKMADLKKESFITGNKDKFQQYELDELAAKYVEIGVEGGQIDKFYCGKASDTYTHTYMRKADSDEVWLVTGSPRSSLSRKPEQWRDKEILALEREMIERVLLKWPRKTIELTREIKASEDVEGGMALADTTWMAHPPRGDSFEPVEKAVNRIMNTFKRMNAIDFMDAAAGDTIPDFSNPEFTVEVFLEGDQHEVIDFVQKIGEDSRYIARKNGDETTVFEVYKSTVNNLRKDEADLKGDEKKDADA